MMLRVRALFQRHWVLAWLLLCAAVLRVDRLAEWISGPYGHWRLWVRGPIAMVMAAAFLWAYFGRHLWVARRRTGWW
jgi:hypothetical protein